MVLCGVLAALKTQCLQVSGLQKTTFPLKYVRVPILASRLSKVECTNLVEKIKAKVHIWATKNLSFAGRAMLINSVIFGMFNYWASIFLLPYAVVENKTKLCRKYLWGALRNSKGSLTSHGAPHTCQKARGDRAEKPLCLEQSNHSEACLGCCMQKRCLVG